MGEKTLSLEKSASCITSPALSFFFPDGTALPTAAGPGTLSGEPPGFQRDSAGPPEGGLRLEECFRPKPRIGTLGVKLLHSRIACLPGPRVERGVGEAEHSQTLAREEEEGPGGRKVPSQRFGLEESSF